MHPLVVYGVSNNLVVKLIDAINRRSPTYQLKGFLSSPSDEPLTDVMGIPVLGGPDVVPALLASEPELRFFCNVNYTPADMREADALLARSGCTVVSLIHPGVDMAFATHGANVALAEGTLVGPNVAIGDHVTCRMGSIISHDVTIEDRVYIGPRVTVCGGARLREGCDIGAGATILPRVTVGRHTIVGAGAVVTRDLPDGVTAVGVPARVIRSQGHPALPN